MSEAEDPYEILGLSADADEAAIKKAFRKIARKCHPDVVGDDPVAKQRFMDARRAYEFLTNDEARQAYDDARERAEAFFQRRAARRARTKEASHSRFSRHVNAGGPRNTTRRVDGQARRTANGRFHVRGGQAEGPVDLNDLFGGTGDFDFGGESPRSRREDPARAPRRGDDVAVEVEVPFRTARDGGAIPVRFDRLTRAPRWVAGDAWPGVEPGKATVDVTIPMGTRHGGVLRIPSEGDAGAYGGPSGDLIVRINLVGHAADDVKHEASGATTELDVRVGVGTALLGGIVNVSGPSGLVKARIRPRTSSGTRLKLRGRGAYQADGTRGDLVIVVQIEVPEDLSMDVLEKLESLVNDHPELL